MPSLHALWHTLMLWVCQVSCWVGQHHWVSTSSCYGSVLCSQALLSSLFSLTFRGVPRPSLLLVWPGVYNEEMKRAELYWPRTDSCSNKVIQTAHLHVRVACVVWSNKWLHWAIVFLLMLMWFPCELTFLQVKQVHIRYQCYHGNASCSAPIDKLMLAFLLHQTVQTTDASTLYQEDSRSASNTRQTVQHTLTVGGCVC